jgi:glycosyltransferase involved in cell wall biosynthesis
MIPTNKQTELSPKTGEPASEVVRTLTSHMPTYVLLTAAHNEEADIARTIESVAAQTVLPERWVIVSDNSTDETDNIVQTYADKHDWIRLLRVSRKPGISFASKIIALKQGEKLLKDVPFDYLGNVDGDVAFEPFYFERLLTRFQENPRLGIAGGYVHDLLDGEFRNRPGNSPFAVAHAGQLVRKECYQAIGGYAVLKYGGEDWHAQVSAKMRGWQTEAFSDLRISHYRPTGTKGSHLNHVFRQGKMDYSLGSYPPFEIFKCLRRIPQKPLFIGGIARLLGFSWSSLIHEDRPVTSEFVAFLRKEQKERMRVWSF